MSRSGRLAFSLYMSMCVSCRFPHETALVACPCAFRLRRHRWPGPGAQPFSCKFPCPCAFRLRRLAQNGCPLLTLAGRAAK